MDHGQEAVCELVIAGGNGAIDFEASEEALDLVSFRQELVDGVEKAFGLPIADAFPASKARKRR